MGGKLHFHAPIGTLVIFREYQQILLCTSVFFYSAIEKMRSFCVAFLFKCFLSLYLILFSNMSITNQCSVQSNKYLILKYFDLAYLPLIFIVSRHDDTRRMKINMSQGWPTTISDQLTTRWSRANGSIAKDTITHRGVCRGVRWEAAVSPTLSATSFSPNAGATPKILSATADFEVHQPCSMMDYRMILRWIIFIS